MKFVVCVKLSPDTEQLNLIEPASVGRDDLGVQMVLNPWDEFAVEEALQLQERFDGDVVAITMGGPGSEEALRQAVAMGVAETVWLSDPAFSGSDAWGTAAVLATAIREQADLGLVIMGKQSVDWNSGLVPPGVACALGAPYLANVIKILDLDPASVTVQRALDEGVQTVRVQLPAVISVSKGINEPRYPNFMGVRKAARTTFSARTAGDLPGLDAEQFGEAAALVEWSGVRKPPGRQADCEIIGGGTAAEKAMALVDRLVADKVI